MTLRANFRADDEASIAPATYRVATSDGHHAALPRYIAAVAEDVTTAAAQGAARARYWNLENNLVGEVMTSTVACVDESTPFKRIVDTLAQYGISAVPVIDSNRHVLGVVSESDLLSRVVAAGDPKARQHSGRVGRHGARKSDGETAAELMSAPAITIRADASVVHAAREAAIAHVRRMPVVDNSGVLVGIVTRSDLLRVFRRSDDAIKAHIEDLVAGQFTLEPSSVSVAVSSGVVTFRGLVERRILIRPVLDAVGAMAGVVAVHDELTYRVNDAIVPSSDDPLY